MAEMAHYHSRNNRGSLYDCLACNPNPPMLSIMKTVYKLTEAGWVRVMTCASFAHACKISVKLTEKTGIEHCVNN